MIKFLDTKNYNLILKDSDEDKVIYTEEAYERLLKNSYKGLDLWELYSLSDELAELFDEIYDSLGYPRESTYFIDPSILKDKSKVEALYDALRQRFLELFNSGDIYYQYDIDYKDHDKLKDIFKLKYTFEDRKYVKDDDWEEVSEEEIQELEKEENPEENKDDSEDEDQGKYIGSTCKEMLEDYANKINKDDPKWYLIQIALGGKSKRWAYIKKADELVGDIERDIVTPRNAKKVMEMLK